MSPNVRVSQIENNKNMKRKERENTRARAKPPKPSAVGKSAAIFVVSPPQTPVLIALLPFRHDPPSVQRSSKGRFTVLPNAKGGLGAREGCRDLRG